MRGARRCTSEEQIAAAFSVESTEREADEDHRGSHEGRHNDAEETDRQTDTLQHVTHISTCQTTPPDPVSPSPGIDSDDKIHGGAEAQAYRGTGEEPS